MKTDSIASLSVEKLKEELAKERESLRSLNFRRAGAQLKEVHHVREVRRNIARILTYIRSKQ